MAGAEDGEARSRRERILEEAEEAFGRLGYARTRLADVAEAVGIRRPSLLYHFPSKADLYRAVLARTFAAVETLAGRELDGARGVAERIDVLIDAYRTYLGEHPGAARIVVREVIDGSEHGEEIILRDILPALDRAAEAVSGHADGALVAGVPVRAALMLIASGLFLRAAASPTKAALWGGGAHLPGLARHLLLADPGPYAGEDDAGGAPA